jgi:hypothetical protein
VIRTAAENVMRAIHILAPVLANAAEDAQEADTAA